MALTKEDYLNRVKEINPDIQIVSEFKRTEKPIKRICPICICNEGKTANGLYERNVESCSNCRGYLQIILEEEYLRRVKKLNPHLQIVSEFNGANHPIQYICPKCHEIKTIKQAGDLCRRQINSCSDCKN